MLPQNITIVDANLILFLRTNGVVGDEGIETGEGTIKTATIELATETKEFKNRKGETLARVDGTPSGTLNVSTANIAAENLARALNGDIVKVVAGTDGVKAIAAAKPGKTYALDHIKVGNVVVSKGATPLVEGVDYTVNALHGRITMSDTFEAGAISIAYEYDAHMSVSMLTKTADEFLARFEGIDLNAGMPSLTILRRVKFSPAKNFPLVSDDFVALDLSASVLADLSIPAGSRDRYGEHKCLV